MIARAVRVLPLLVTLTACETTPAMNPLPQPTLTETSDETTFRNANGTYARRLRTADPRRYEYEYFDSAGRLLGRYSDLDGVQSGEHAKAKWYEAERRYREAAGQSRPTSSTRSRSN